jgi:hypothetical protein
MAVIYPTRAGARLVLFSAATVAIAAACSNKAFTDPETRPFGTVSMTGANVVPAVTTTGSGTATFDRSVEMNYVNYVVTLTNMQGVTNVDLRIGAAGQNQAATAPLISIFQPIAGAASVDVNGVFMQSNFAGSELNWPNLPAGATKPGLDSLQKLIDAGQVYLVVRTTANPNGAIRGQIQKP